MKVTNFIPVFFPLFCVVRAACNHPNHNHQPQVYRSEYPNEVSQSSYRPQRRYRLYDARSGPPQQLLVPKTQELDRESNGAEFRGVWETKVQEETLWASQKVAVVKKYQTKGAFEGKMTNRNSEFLTKLIRGKPATMSQRSMDDMSSYSSPPVIRRFRRQATGGNPPPPPAGAPGSNGTQATNGQFNPQQIVESIPGMNSDPKGVSEKIKETWMNFKQEAQNQFSSLKQRIQEGAARIRALIEGKGAEGSNGTTGATGPSTTSASG